VVRQPDSRRIFDYHWKTQASHSSWYLRVDDEGLLFDELDPKMSSPQCIVLPSSLEKKNRMRVEHREDGGWRGLVGQICNRNDDEEICNLKLILTYIWQMTPQGVYTPDNVYEKRKYFNWTLPVRLIFLGILMLFSLVH
jgi:hypothetical protein